MKKLLTLITISTLLWSCGSQFSRSKYDRHLWNRSKGGTFVKEKQSDSEMVSEIKTFSPEVTIPAITPNQDDNNFVAINNEYLPATIEKQNTKTTIAITEKDLRFENENNTTLQTTEKNKTKKKTPGSPMKDDVALILLVILCLFPFINLIPVYIHDGGITKNFWITLILDCLFFLPGIIYALLVVLDVI